MIRLLTKLDTLADWTGNLLAPLTFLMMLLMCIVVLARYLLDLGLTPVIEATMYLHACVFMLGIAYTLRTGGHVRVDIIYQRLSPRRQASIDMLGTLVFLLPFTLFVLYASIDYVALSIRMKEGSAEPGGLPYVYLLKCLMPLMAILLTIQAVSELSKAWQRLAITGRDAAASDKHP